MRQKTVFMCMLTAFLMIGMALSLRSIAVSAKDRELLTTRAAFEKAINSAKDGDTILVGDIDFNLVGEGAVNEAEKIVLKKNITIQNGKTGGNAVFYGASFILEGTRVAGETTQIQFSGITFDEGIGGEELTEKDWEPAYYGDGNLISATPLKCQYAIGCQGNLNASFEGCEFRNYMYTYGPAIWADYTTEANALCRLKLTLKDCEFEENSALTCGGAVYVRGDDNASLTASDCTFSGNRSGFTMGSMGGGAVGLWGCSADFTNCVFIGNTANYFYGGDRFFDFGYVPEMGGNFVVYEDRIAGGAIYAYGCSIRMRNCSMRENVASFGGALALELCTADFEDCVISENKAVSVLEEEYKNKEYGIGSCNGIGGAIYIDGAKGIAISNTEISGNYADSAHGGIYTTYVTYDPEFYEQFSLKLLFCTIRDNTCGMKIAEYINNDTGGWLYDIHMIPYVETYGCVVIDEIYRDGMPRYEEATVGNGYTYYGYSAPETWYEDGHLLHAPIVPIEFVQEKLGDRNYYGTFTIGANNHDVTFRFFSDGECRESVTLPSGVLPVLPDFVKEGYTVSSWKLAEEIDYREGEPFVFGNKTESVDVHVVYTPNTYRITFDFGYNQSETELIFGTALTLPEVIERSGYRFIGWFTMPGGEGELLVDGANFLTGRDVTYYAYYQKKAPVLGIAVATVIVLIAAGSVTAWYIYRRREIKAEVATAERKLREEAKTAEAAPVIVKTRYTDDEIERILREVDEVQLLTERERDVFCELLKGRKQSEIGYYLGISVPYVKDNAGRIYGKFGVANKNELFEKIASKMQKS